MPSVILDYFDILVCTRQSLKRAAFLSDHVKNNILCMAKINVLVTSTAIKGFKAILCMENLNDDWDNMTMYIAINASFFCVLIDICHFVVGFIATLHMPDQHLRRRLIEFN